MSKEKKKTEVPGWLSQLEPATPDLRITYSSPKLGGDYSKIKQKQKLKKKYILIEKF